MLHPRPLVGDSGCGCNISPVSRPVTAGGHPAPLLAIGMAGSGPPCPAYACYARAQWPLRVRSTAPPGLVYRPSGARLPPLRGSSTAPPGLLPHAPQAAFSRPRGPRAALRPQCPRGFAPPSLDTATPLVYTLWCVCGRRTHDPSWVRYLCVVALLSTQESVK